MDPTKTITDPSRTVTRPTRNVKDPTINVTRTNRIDVAGGPGLKSTTNEGAPDLASEIGVSQSLKMQS